MDLLVGRLGGDVELAAEVIGLFIRHSPARVAAIRTALDSGDADQLRIAAHALKGVAGNVAANRLVSAADVLEQMGAAGLIAEARASWPGVVDEVTAVVASLQRCRIAASRSVRD